MISLEKLKILTPLQKLPKNVVDLGKLIVAKGLEVAQSPINRPFWSHWWMCWREREREMREEGGSLMSSFCSNRLREQWSEIEVNGLISLCTRLARFRAQSIFYFVIQRSSLMCVYIIFALTKPICYFPNKECLSVSFQITWIFFDARVFCAAIKPLPCTSAMVIRFQSSKADFQIW